MSSDAPKRRISISSRTYFALALVSLVVGAVGYLILHPLALGAAIVVAFFFLAGAIYSLANERRWLD